MERSKAYCHMEKIPGVSRNVINLTYLLHVSARKKAWMTGEIVNDILSKLNRQLSRNDGRILLLMDKAGCHPEDFYQKIKDIFLTTQYDIQVAAFGLGNNKNIRLHYRN